MSENSKIAWTDHTFNPWWGCVKVSEGCKHCYAETLSGRYGFDVWGMNAPRRFFGEKHWQEPLNWNKKAEKEGKRARVFCGSMMDVFEEREDLNIHRLRLWQLIADTPSLDWLLLTKRPENINKFLPGQWVQLGINNLWLGTTVENQKRADERIQYLINLPAKVRFISVEPMLERIDLVYWDTQTSALHPYGSDKKIDWVIVGGESGSNHRPFEWDWARDIRDQCKDAGVSFFMKQGAGKSQAHMPEIPDDLMIREFPA